MNTYPTRGRPPIERFDYSQLKYLEGALLVPVRKMTAEEIRKQNKFH